jgi:hypothetical protein
VVTLQLVGSSENGAHFVLHWLQFPPGTQAKRDSVKRNVHMLGSEVRTTAFAVTVSESLTMSAFSRIQPSMCSDCC